MCRNMPNTSIRLSNPQDRSGEGAESTKFTSGDHVARGDGKAGYGRKGGSPWTEKWLKFDNRCGVRLALRVIIRGRVG